MYILLGKGGNCNSNDGKYNTDSLACISSAGNVDNKYLLVLHKTLRYYVTVLCYGVMDIYKVLLISAWRVIGRPCGPLFSRRQLRMTNYRGGAGRGRLTIIITAIHLIGHVSRTVEPFVAPLMQRDAMAVIAHPFVRAAPTVISLHRPIVTAQLVAVVVRAIDPAIATLMVRYTIAALTAPLPVRAYRIGSFSFVVKLMSLCCVFAELLRLSRLSE